MQGGFVIYRDLGRTGHRVRRPVGQGFNTGTWDVYQGKRRGYYRCLILPATFTKVTPVYSEVQQFCHAWSYFRLRTYHNFFNMKWEGGGRKSNPTFTLNGGEIKWRDSLVYSHVCIYVYQTQGSDSLRGRRTNCNCSHILTIHLIIWSRLRSELGSIFGLMPPPSRQSMNLYRDYSYRY